MQRDVAGLLLFDRQNPLIAHDQTARFARRIDQVLVRNILFQQH
jgi:hypothetical protein